MRNKNYIKNLSVIALAVLSVSLCHAQNFVLDSTFNTNGIMQFNFYNNIDRAYGCALQPDQKLVVAGLSKNSSTNFFELCIARLNVDGSFDTTFSSDGKAYVSLGNQSSIGGQTPVIKITSDGKIVAANTGRSPGGNSQDIMACRLDSSGNLDNTFNGNGSIFIDMTGAGTQPDVANAMDIDVNGNIWLTGATRTGGTPIANDFAVAKITPSGTLDPSFDGDGKILFDPTGSAEFGTGIKVQPDGLIVFSGKAGANSMILRIDSSGAFDTSFNGTGMATVTFSGSSYPHAMEIDSSGRIIIAGTVTAATTDIGVARYLNNGTPDATFGSNGQSTFNYGGQDDEATSMALTSDHKILIGGYTYKASSGTDFLAMRVDSAGSIDSTFNGNGYYTKDVSASFVDDEANGIALMDDGRIVLSGTIVFGSAINEDIAIVRIKPIAVTTGMITFSPNTETSVYPNPCNNHVTLTCKTNSKYQLTDLEGRIIKHIETKAGSNTIDVGQYESGIYFLKNIHTGKCTKLLKL